MCGISRTYICTSSQPRTSDEDGDTMFGAGTYLSGYYSSWIIIVIEFVIDGVCCTGGDDIYSC